MRLFDPRLLGDVIVTRLSNKQLSFLGAAAACEIPSDDFPNGLPLYVHSRFMEFDFNSESEKLRWVRNLEARGLVSADGPMGCFVRLTAAGRAAITKATTP